MTIPINVSEFNNGKILTIYIYINGIRSRFLLDTGASVSIIDLRKVYKYTSKKPLKSFKMSSFSNDLETYTINIDNFKIGEKIIYSYDFQITDLINLNNTFSTNNINTIDGILGNDIIFEYIKVIDIDNKMIIVKT